MKEEWRPVVGLEGYYEVSNYGGVRSINRTILKHCKHKIARINLKGKTITPHLRRDGYPFVDLYKEHKRYSLVVHRLVAQAFVPNPNNRPEVDHINTIRTDARAINLRWVNRSENNLNPITRKRMIESGKGKYGKPVIQYDKDGNFIASFKSIKEASRITGINKGLISSYLKGRHINKKFNWEYGTF